MPNGSVKLPNFRSVNNEETLYLVRNCIITERRISFGILLDRPMQLNHGKFRQNGKCGYVLRPDFMFRRNFHPGREKDLATNDIQTLTFKITVKNILMM